MTVPETRSRTISSTDARAAPLLQTMTNAAPENNRWEEL